MEIYIAINKQQAGPFSEEQIMQMVSSGMVSPTDLAWHDALIEWVPLNQIINLPDSQNAPTPSPIPSSPLPIAAAVGPRGIKGWLLFFCILTTTVNPLLKLLGAVSLFFLWSQHNPIEQIHVVRATVLLITALYSAVTGIIIRMGSPHGRTLAKTYLVIAALVWLVMGIVRIMYDAAAGSTHEVPTFQGVVFGWMMMAIYFLIWWFYFKNSKRVRNTYG